MNNETSKPIKILCILSFILVAISSIPLLVSYIKGVEPKNSFIVDLHVWAGTVFIIVATLRIIRTKIGKQKNKKIITSDNKVYEVQEKVR